MKENNLLNEILNDARIGWWKVDFGRGVFILSDYLRQAVGLTEVEVEVDRFMQMISESFRNQLSVSMLCEFGQFSCEQVFPLQCRYGETWFRWKILKREICPDGSVVITGYSQQITPEEEKGAALCSAERMNNLLYRLNSISHTLLSFLHTDEIDQSINKVLADILKMFKGSRAYIAEFEWERRLHVYTYEVTDKGVESGYNEVDQLSMDDTPWWIEHLSKGNPVILSTLDDLPPEAFRERNILSEQGICSLLVLPLMTRDKLWGYAGIDVVGETRTWHNDDYQWFAALVNIVNICIGLQRSEREAQTERDYLQTLYRYMPMGYVRLKVLYDRMGNPVNYIVLDSNYAADAIIGKQGKEYIGKTALDLRVDLVNYMPSIIQTLSTEHFVETDSNLPDGKYIHAILYSTLQDEVTCLFSDTTEMRSTHDALDRSEKMLRNIYDNIPVGVELYDKNGLMVDINKKDMEIFGVQTKEDVLGVNFFENPIASVEIRERVRKGEEFTFKLFYPFDHLGEYYATNKTGYIEIYTSVSILYNAQGEVVNFMLINIDNTEINRAHSRIAEFESSFSLVSRFGKVGYARFDLLTKQGYALPQWYHNLGEKEDTPLDQVIGVYTHVDPVDKTSIFESIRRVKAGEIDSFSHDLRITIDGEIRWTRINVICNPLNNDPSKIEMICVNFDITELKGTEKNLLEAKNKAEVSDRLKSAFLANMSHEIRTPLNAIVGFSTLLTESDDPEERNEYLGIVLENNDLLLKLISDILDLSKIEAGTLELNNAEFDVDQMCQEIIRSLNIKVGDKPLELRLGEDLPDCRLLGDKTRLTQVLSNFINNALKFTTKGAITLRYFSDGGKTLTFSVEDTGTGIPAQDLDSVFGRFVKLNTFVQGTGLGLAICKSIIEQMGGTIGVRSEEGKGSCFWFTIPYVMPKQHTIEIAEEIEEPLWTAITDGKKPVVLVAEDTESNYLLLSLLLRKEFDVHRACNGVEAVRMCRELTPDVILMDIKMPEMDGLEATRQIRLENNTVPIIATTAFAYDQDRQRALDAGCNDYLSKPVAGDVLKQKLRSFLKS